MSGNYGSLSKQKKYTGAIYICILLGCYRVSYFATTTKGRYGSIRELLRASPTGL